jgi:predicted metalloprotease
VIEQHQGPAPAPPADDAGAKFVSQVLRSTEVVWTDVFRQAGPHLPAPKLVLFRDQWNTGCGRGRSGDGAVLLPDDQKVYIDLSFYDDAGAKLGAPGSSPRRTSLRTRSAITCRT